MARVNIPVQGLNDRNKFAASAAFASMTTAVDATDGAEISWKERDDKYLIFLQNTAAAAKKVTIKAGNGIEAVNDIDIDIAASSYTFVAIDSMRFKNVCGVDKGKVIILGASTDIKVAVFKLP